MIRLKIPDYCSNIEINRSIRRMEFYLLAIVMDLMDYLLDIFSFS